jgi:adenosyl cobinamide kinase/adenosyl cobinamide phosphate guanylyltransferase
VITLVLGGTRSGKSEVAERAAGLGRAVTYVATAGVVGDEAFAARVEAHRRRRPTGWRTVELAGDLPELLRATPGVVLVDSLGAWVTREDCRPDVGALCDALRRRADPCVLVSEEVGLGVHAPTEIGLRFADALGDCNRRVAAVADRVLFVVAGRVLELGAPDATGPAGTSGEP